MKLFRKGAESESQEAIFQEEQFQELLVEDGCPALDPPMARKIYISNSLPLVIVSVPQRFSSHVFVRVIGAQ